MCPKEGPLALAQPAVQYNQHGGLFALLPLQLLCMDCMDQLGSPDASTLLTAAVGSSRGLGKKEQPSESACNMALAFPVPCPKATLALVGQGTWRSLAPAPCGTGL